MYVVKKTKQETAWERGYTLPCGEGNMEYMHSYIILFV